MRFGCFGFRGMPDVCPKDSGEFRRRFASCPVDGVFVFPGIFCVLPLAMERRPGASPEKPSGCTENPNASALAAGQSAKIRQSLGIFTYEPLAQARSRPGVSTVHGTGVDQQDR